MIGRIFDDVIFFLFGERVIILFCFSLMVWFVVLLMESLGLIVLSMIVYNCWVFLMVVWRLFKVFWCLVLFFYVKLNCVIDMLVCNSFFNIFIDWYLGFRVLIIFVNVVNGFGGVGFRIELSLKGFFKSNKECGIFFKL